MEKNSVTPATPAGTLATRNRQPLLARFFLLALVLAFSLLSLQPQTSAQAASPQPRAVAPDCSGSCEQAYIQCANNGGSSCETQYYSCLLGCR